MRARTHGDSRERHPTGSYCRGARNPGRRCTPPAHPRGPVERSAYPPRSILLAFGVDLDVWEWFPHNVRECVLFVSVSSASDVGIHLLEGHITRACLKPELSQLRGTRVSLLIVDGVGELLLHNQLREFRDLMKVGSFSPLCSSALCSPSPDCCISPANAVAYGTIAHCKAQVQSPRSMDSRELEAVPR